MRQTNTCSITWPNSNRRANTRVLVLNDSFGALAASLAGKVKVTSSGDSFLAFQGLEKNLVRNGLAFDAVPHVPASEALTGPV